MIELAPENIGPYKPEQLLASGPRTEVWSATGPSGPVVLKVARRPEDRPALAHEATMLGRVQHPRLVRLVDHDPEGAWLALEKVEGETLQRWAEGRGPREIAAVAAQVVEAVQALHAAGVVHADLKPANVLVDEAGEAVLLDLGIAVADGRAPKGFRGTPGFAAPEVLRGQPPTTAADVHGLGGLLYAALTGRPPFSAPDPAALAWLPLVSLPPPPGALRPDLPGMLCTLILALLARDPARRPSDLDRVARLLAKAAASPPGAPVLGMDAEREALRQAVVGAADGECRVAVVYGPPGCGRLTLITEAVEAARREGLPYVKGLAPAEALPQVRASKRPPVLALRAGQEGLLVLGLALLTSSVPCLLLVHAERPLPALVARGALQLTPPPLTVDEARVLVGRLEGDVEEAPRIWRESQGHPLGIVARVRAWRRARGLHTADLEHDLPAASRRVLHAMRASREATLPELATQLGVGEHELLDHADVLLAEGAIEVTRKGHAFKLTALGEG